MKAITLHQPWASLIAVGAKTIETRPRGTDYRGPLAIHAAARPLSTEIKRNYYGIWPGQRHTGLIHGPVGARVANVLDAAGYQATDGSDLPLGAVVASATLVDVVPIVEGPVPVYPTDDQGPRIYVPENSGLWYVGERARSMLSCPTQRPFGDFTPGRFAWLLADVAPTTTRCPWCYGTGDCAATGCSAKVGACETCDTTGICPVCSGAGKCEPVPARGQQATPWEWTPGEGETR